MEQITLKATKRDLLGKKVKSLRRENKVPSVLYGRKFTPISLTLDSREFRKVASVASESTLISIELDDKNKFQALIRGIQKHPVTGEVLHVDLYKVDMTQEIETEIPLKFEGISKAVEELEGNFITNKDTIRVKCLPNKLVNEIIVDISVLQTFEDFIHVKDLGVPEGIEVLEDEEDVIAQVSEPISEEELEAMESEAAASTEKEQIENIEAEAEKEKAEAAGEGEETTENVSPTSQKNE